MQGNNSLSLLVPLLSAFLSQTNANFSKRAQVLRDILYQTGSSIIQIIQPPGETDTHSVIYTTSRTSIVLQLNPLSPCVP